MNKIFTGIAISALASSLSIQSVLADDYQFEVNGFGLHSDFDGDTSTDFGLGIQYNFVPVDTSSGPLAEAVFINRSSNISANQYREGDFDGRVTTLAGELYIPNTMFYLGVQYLNLNDGDAEGWITTAGILPIDNLLLTTSYTKDTSYETNIAAKYLHELGDSQALVFRAGYAEDEDWGDSYNVGMDYYFNQKTGLGFNFSDDDGDQDTEIHLTHFFENDFYAGVSLTNGELTDSIAVSGGFRF